MWGSASRESQSAAPPLEIQVRDLDAERKDGPTLSMGWLLRLFRSEFFDAFMAITYLYRYRDSGGVHDYLCNQLYALQDEDLETFMPQVCNLLIHHARQSPALERFVLDKCADSMHIALQVFWFLQAAVEDAARKPDRKAESRVRLLRTRCETAAVNGSKHVMLAAAAERISAATLVAAEPDFSPRLRQVPATSLFPSNSASDIAGRGCHNGEVRDEKGKGKKLRKRKNVSPLKMGPDVAVGVDATTRTDGPIADNRNTLVDDPKTVGPIGTVDNIDDTLDADDYREDGDDSDDIKKMRTALGHIVISADATHVEADVSEGNVIEDNDARTKEAKKSDGNETNTWATPRKNPHRLQPDLDADFDPLALLAMKQERFDYFNDSISIAKAFVRLSLTTRDKPGDERQVHLSSGLQEINDMLLRRMKGEPGEPLVDGAPPPLASEVAKLGLKAALRSVHLPLTRASSQALRILRVHSEEVVILTSRTRAPYMVNIEVLPTDMICSDKLLFCEHRVKREDQGDEGVGMVYGGASVNTLCDGEDPATSSLRVGPKTKRRGMRRLSEMTPSERQQVNVRKAVYGDAFTSQPDIFAEAEASAKKELENADVESIGYKSRQAVILGIYGELWSWKEERILGKSEFKDLKDTKLMPFIVKAGDDLRQEQLAVQLIGQFDKVFKEEKVEVFLKPFTVMSVSSEAGFVEVITDAVSVHALKKRTPNFVSLLDYFKRAFGEIGSDGFRAAQRRFIRSMAGYSLVTYFLQIKDRHNGNIMLDTEGRVIHIDFGFMLTNSPGAIKFENVPFKLTEEYLQVICGLTNVQHLGEASKTEGYRYFQELFVLGLLAARKHYEKITTLVEIMTEGTTMPCMTNGQTSGHTSGGRPIMEALTGRFAVAMPEEQCINFALSLIEESRLSWRSAGYDRFQAYSNGYR